MSIKRVLDKKDQADLKASQLKKNQEEDEEGNNLTVATDRNGQLASTMMESDAQSQLNTNNCKTEVEVKTQRTRFKIQHGFWMRGDFFIVLSYERKTDKYYLEMYRYNEIPDMIDMEFLFQSKERLEISVELNEGRKLASILVEEFNTQTQQFMKSQIYLLSSSEFRIAPRKSNEQKFKLNSGMTIICNKSLPARQPFYDYSKLFQKFMYDDKKVEIKVKLFFQYSEDPAQSVISQSNQQLKSDSPIHKYETQLFQIVTPQMFLRDQRDQNKTSGPLDIQEGHISQNGLRFNPNINAQTELVQKVENSHFLNKKIIGVFRMPKRVSITVYEDGTVQRDNIVAPSKLAHLLLPFPEATHAMITMLSSEVPMLILQNKSFIAVGFVLNRDVWTRQFTIEKSKYLLQQSFGPFLVGIDLKDRTMKILELGGKEDNTIVTEFPFGRQGVADFKVDAYYEKSNFAIKYEKGTIQFTWFKFDQQQQLYHMKSNHITQVCEGYQVELKQKSNKLSFYDLSKLDESQNHFFDVRLPSSFSKSQIFSFYPIMNESKTYMVLALSYGKNLEFTYRDEKFHGILLIDIKKKKAVHNENTDPFKTIMFKTDKDLLCQNRSGVYKVEIVREQFCQQSQTGNRLLSKEPDYNSFSSSEDSDGILNDVKSPKRRNSTVERTIVVTQLVVHKEYQIKEDYESQILFGVRNDQVLVFQVSDLTINAYIDKDLPNVHAKQSNSFDQNYLEDDKPRRGFSSKESVRKLSQKDGKDLVKGKELIKLKPPHEYFTLDKRFLRRYACMSNCKKYVYVVMSNFATNFITQLEFKTFKGEERLVKNGDPVHLPQRSVLGVKCLNTNQIILQTLQGFTVYNVKSRLVNFKVKFVNVLNINITSSLGVVAVPRTTNGVLINFGEELEMGETMNCQKKGISMRKSQLCCRKKTKTVSSEAAPVMKCELKNMNDISRMYCSVYTDVFDKKGGYIFLDESIVNWNSRHKLMPLKIMLPDTFNSTTSYEMTDHKGNKTKIRMDYEETPFLCLTYNNNFTIWETLIRKAILEGTVEITKNQLDRICNPALGDQNRNLLHHMSESHRFEQLETVFNKTSLKSFVNEKHKRFPIFLNFNRKSPLDLAIEQFDFESFQLLLRTTIEFQEGWESSHLIQSWLLRAIYLNLDITRLFDSKVCTQRITEEEFKNSKSFLRHSEDKSTKIVAINGGITNLLYDPNVYCDLFEQMFPTPSESAVATKELDHIEYQADYLFKPTDDPQVVGEFIKHLAETKNMRLFQSGFIQRQINYIWDGNLRYWLYLLLAQHSVTCILIIISICLLTYEKGTPEANIRFYINMFNSLIVSTTFLSYLVPLMMNQGIGRFKDGTNVDYLFFLLTFYSVVVTDAIYGTDSNDIEGNPHKEMVRILYSCLILFSFITLLFLLRVFDNVSFIVKMLMRVEQELRPFIILFGCTIFVDSLVFMTLGFSLTDIQDDPYSGVQQLGYSLFMLRTSIGDFEVDPFSELPMASRIVMWFLWVSIIFMNTIILLNFLIAVISDVYEQVMETRTEEIFQKKAMLLFQIESVLGNSDRDHPQILITRSGEIDHTHSAWCGFLSEVKKNMIDQSQSFQRTIGNHNENLVRDMDNKHKEITEAIKSLQNRTYNIEHLLLQMSSDAQQQIKAKQEGALLQIDQTQLQLFMQNAIEKHLNQTAQNEQSDPQ